MTSFSKPCQVSKTTIDSPTPVALREVVRNFPSSTSLPKKSAVYFVCSAKIVVDHNDRPVSPMSVDDSILDTDLRSDHDRTNTRRAITNRLLRYGGASRYVQAHQEGTNHSDCGLKVNEEVEANGARKRPRMR